MNKFIIYVLHHPSSSSVYVGKSCSGMERPRAHMSPSNRAKQHLPVVRWINKLIAHEQKYEIAIVETCKSAIQLCEAERFYIAYLRSLGVKLLNCTDGGEGAPGVKLSEERKRQISVRFKGKKLSEEHRAKLSKSARQRDPAHLERLRSYGRNMTAETRAKMSVAHSGKPLSDKHHNSLTRHLQRVGFYRRGTKRTPETIAKMSAAANNPSFETRAKMSAAQRRRSPASVETRRKMSEARRGHEVSTETREKISIKMSGHSVSTEARMKISVAHRGKRLSEVTCHRMSESRRGHATSAATRAKIGVANRHWTAKMKINLLAQR